MNVVIIDGGGTKTRGWVANLETGECSADAAAGPSNIGLVGESGLAEELGQVRQRLNLTKPAERVLLGLAGVGRQTEHDAAETIARKIFPDSQVVVTTDAHLAYRGAFTSGKYGILLIAGTGTIALYQNPSGHEFFRAGGWGSLLGDEGGGTWIGRQALRHCLREWENDELTPFHGAVLAEIGAEDSENLITQVYHGDFGPAKWASLAPLVFRFSREDPGVARILRRGAVHLIALAERLIENMPQSSATIPMAIIGGLWEQQGILKPLLLEEIEIRNLPLAIVPPEGGPLEGGLVLARSKELF